ncbi:hypothetical protein HYU22_02060 [Candidatus Woesearchaeota archaeon]|nr:hypothetical protein [Candidatus Woesearchaeota archaeon]
MSKPSIPRIVYQMNPYDLVLLTILEKPTPEPFREETLAYGFREVAGADPKIGSLLLLPDKANGHGIVSGLELAIIQMQSFRVLEEDSSGQLYFSERFRAGNIWSLRRWYGSRIDEKLRPFARNVWKAARDYPVPNGSVAGIPSTGTNRAGYWDE